MRPKPRLTRPAKIHPAFGRTAGQAARRRPAAARRRVPPGPRQGGGSTARVVDDRGGVTTDRRREHDRDQGRVIRAISRPLMLDVLDHDDTAGAGQPVALHVRRQGALRMDIDGEDAKADDDGQKYQQEQRDRDRRVPRPAAAPAAARCTVVPRGSGEEVVLRPGRAAQPVLELDGHPHQQAEEDETPRRVRIGLAWPQGVTVSAQRVAEEPHAEHRAEQGQARRHDDAEDNAQTSTGHRFRG